MDKSIADLRKSYERDALDEQASSADPLQQFEHWLQQALDAQIPEPNAMTLATVGSDARPSTRVVLLKGFDARGIVWYTNYQSRKGRELAAHPQAALQFHWVELERVVRIEGRIAPGLARLYEFDSAASGVIRQNLDVVAFARETGLALRPLAVVQLDGAAAPADGLQRQWTPAVLDVSKHHGYALQWFALSTLITGLYVWFQLLRPRRRRSR